jgi:hypothetical protein
VDKEIVAVRGSAQSVAVGAGGDLGDDLGSWPVRIEDEKGSDCETEKQKCCDRPAAEACSRVTMGGSSSSGLLMVPSRAHGPHLEGDWPCNIRLRLLAEDEAKGEQLGKEQNRRRTYPPEALSNQRP